VIIDDISRHTDDPEGDPNANVFIVTIGIVDLPNLRQLDRALLSGFILSPQVGSGVGAPGFAGVENAAYRVMVEVVVECVPLLQVIFELLE
jgi:hypothetical protein